MQEHLQILHHRATHPWFIYGMQIDYAGEIKRLAFERKASFRSARHETIAWRMSVSLRWGSESSNPGVSMKKIWESGRG